MAGDWIKMEHVTPDKPEVYRMATILGVSPEEIVGHLVRVWIWADQQSIDGNAVGVSNVTLDTVSRRIGFGSAMREVGWLGGDGDTLSFPNFERHNGETAKERALTYKRVKRHRNAQGVSNALPEKRREDKKETTTAVPADAGFVLPAWIPKDCWDSFVEMRPKVRAPLTKRGMSLIVGELEKLRDSGSPPGPVLEQSVLNSWKGVFALKPGAKVTSGDWKDDPRFRTAQ